MGARGGSGWRRLVVGVLVAAQVAGVCAVMDPAAAAPSAPEVGADASSASWADQDFGGAPTGEPAEDVGVPPTEWEAPPEGDATVVLDATGEAEPVSTLPIEVTPVTEAAEGLELQVTVEGQDLAEDLGVAGFVFTVTEVPTDPVVAADPAPAPVTGETTTGSADATTSASAGSTGRADDGDQKVEIAVDYGSLVGRYGGGFADRLQLVSYPACVLDEPILADCAVVGTPMTFRNDRTRNALVVVLDELDDVPIGSGPAAEEPQAPPDTTSTTSTTVPDTTTTSEDPTTTTSSPEAQLEAQSAGAPTPFGGGGGAVYALTSGGSGNEGDFGATPLPLSGEWQVGIGSGSFTWSYDVPIQPGPAGDVPALSLDYSSQAVDGMVGGKNNQSPDIGLGWSYTQPFIERRYVPCSQDGGGIADLCWKTDNAMLTLNGVSTELVMVSGSGGAEWRAKDDPNWKVTRSTSGVNDDNDDEMWKVITPDGTVYTFGRGQTYELGGQATKSVWTVPVYGNNAGEPCNAGAGWCMQAWRWNLDRVVDLHGNVISYFYDDDTNKYGRAGTPGNATTYTSGGRLARIEYGQRSGSSVNPMAKVELWSEYRCNTLSSSCPAPTPTNGTDFPDVPNDLICTGSTCSGNYSPSFFSTKRITDIKVHTFTSGSVYDLVDHISLSHEWLGNGEDPDGDGMEDKSLFLRHISPVGHSESTIWLT